MTAGGQSPVGSLVLDPLYCEILSDGLELIAAKLVVLLISPFVLHVPEGTLVFGLVFQMRRRARSEADRFYFYFLVLRYGIYIFPPTYFTVVVGYFSEFLKCSRTWGKNP